ncbi:hypothetical protein SPHINGO8AM_120110 [Sphingomonas sp. 8AM]|nr:hypothetical protein SPHINGO8AM_120110 [Sphingomonas sp. 8AM]
MRCVVFDTGRGFCSEERVVTLAGSIRAMRPVRTHPDSKTPPATAKSKAFLMPNSPHLLTVDQSITKTVLILTYNYRPVFGSQCRFFIINWS